MREIFQQRETSARQRMAGVSGRRANAQLGSASRKSQEARFPQSCRAPVAVIIFATALALFTSGPTLSWIDGLLIGLAVLVALVLLKRWKDEMTWRSLRDRELALMDEMQRTGARAVAGFRRSPDAYPQHHRAGLSG